TTKLAHITDFFLYALRDHRALHSFPTRRSSDLEERPSLQRLRRDTAAARLRLSRRAAVKQRHAPTAARDSFGRERARGPRGLFRSEEHTSELQSQSNLVCRLLLEKKKVTQTLRF